MTDRLVLISFPTCPFVQRAVIALKEKQVDHEVVYIDLANKPDWFLAISPLGKVPVLKVERPDVAPAYVFESAVIVEYLDETTPGPRLHPADPLERAQHRSWIEYASQLLGDIWKFTSATVPADLDAARSALAAKLERLDGVATGPFFAGERFSLVDAAFAPAFRQLDLIEAEAPTGLFATTPRLNAWRKALAGRESVATAVPPDYAESFFARLRKTESLILKPAA